MIYLWFNMLGCRSAALIEVEKVDTEQGTEDTQSDSQQEDAWTGQEAAINHMEALQIIAEQNNGNRAAGTQGYTDSVEYVRTKLEDAGYTVEIDEFSFPMYQILEEPVINIADQAINEVGVLYYSPGGEVQALIQAVDVQIPPGGAPNSSTSGCESSDFDGFVAGHIALIQRGSCTFHDKAMNAEQAGASGVIIFNEGQPGRQEVLEGTLGQMDLTIPVLGVSFDTGNDLISAANEGVSVYMKLNALSQEIVSENILAERDVGDPNSVMVVGAHLDSVPAGPGVNDNGSGVASILTLAEHYAEIGLETKNRLRFAFWGAEELGLIGSYKYLEELPEEQRRKIQAKLNFDMVASPNYARFIYDGDGSSSGQEGPQGSDVIEAVLNEFYREQGLTVEPTAFDGRSDYGPFIALGIPAGGLFTGAEEVKNNLQADAYGGEEGEAFDACYHEECDTDANINYKGLLEMLGGIDHTTRWIADYQEFSRSRPRSDFKKRFNLLERHADKFLR